jgi:hypothetical protein
MGRKWGQWLRDPKEFYDGLSACGFALTPPPDSAA